MVPLTPPPETPCRPTARRGSIRVTRTPSRRRPFEPIRLPDHAMSRTVIPCVGLLLSVAVLLRAEPPVANAPGSPATKLPPAKAGAVDFIKDVEPILAARCLNCHDAKKHKGGLRLDDAKSALAGGDSGAVILPGAKA